MISDVMIGAALVGLVLVGCGSDAPLSDPAVATNRPATPDVSFETATTSASTDSSPAPTPTTTSPTTTSPPSAVTAASSTSATTAASTTLPPGPPTFDPDEIGSNLLPNFILTTTVANTNSGQTQLTVRSYGSTDEPRSAYELDTYSFDGGSGSERTFFVDGRIYNETQTGDWYIDEQTTSAAGEGFMERLDLRSGIVGGMLSADFVESADFAGVPANHFVFDETDLASYASYTPENPSPIVEGELYLALDGNYVLYAHSKESSPNRVYEVTEEMSFIGSVAEITLPADLAPMEEAMDLGVALGSLLPPGSTLSSMIRYSRGIGIDYYRYRSSVNAIDEFLSFYRALQPTNGWAVTHVGHIRPHLEQTNCETDVECVILNNGGEQIVVSFAGAITLEYDHEHVFSPLS